MIKKKKKKKNKMYILLELDLEDGRNLGIARDWKSHGFKCVYIWKKMTIDQCFKMYFIKNWKNNKTRNE